MSLKVTSTENRPGVITISPIGSIDARTHTILEEHVDSVLSQKPNVILFATAHELFVVGGNIVRR